MTNSSAALDRSPAGVLAQRLRKARRFLRSPKGYLTVALLVLGAIALPSGGGGLALLATALAVAAAAATELVLVHSADGVWRFPSSAVLSGLLIGLILSAHEPWYIAPVAGVLAIDTKHLLRAGRSHIFNPAALALVLVYFLFASGQGWWGAMGSLPLPAIVFVIVAGYLVADRANKLPAALSFLAAYVGLLTGAAFLGGSATVAELFRVPFINAAVFFAFFMVTDPPTSPVKFNEQIWFGAFVGVISYLIYVITGGGLYFLLAGVLAGNACYAAWRLATRPRRAPAPVRDRRAING